MGNEVMKVDFPKLDQRLAVCNSQADKTTNAKWTTAYINSLPDSSFLYIEPGGSKDDNGKTKPRGLRHFPYKDDAGKIDMPHLRNALSRIPQSNVPASAKKAATAKAKRLLKQTTKNSASDLQHVIMNIAKANVRYDEMEGREYLVVPCISIVEGVHDGSNGPLYYPAEELAKTPQAWNAKPVVVYHPEINGVGVSACDPVIMSTRKIGLMMNTEYDEDTGLKHEIWLDVEKCAKVDGRILEAVENHEIMECSTGLFTDNDETEGEWNGEPYYAIARNYRPDHLALLPDRLGACSIEDGAGFLRVNAADDDFTVSEWIHVVYRDGTLYVNGEQQEDCVINLSDFQQQEQSYDEIRTQLSNKLYETKEDAWVTDVYDAYFIYSMGGKYYRQKYSIKKDVVSFDGIAEQVVRVTDYKLATSNTDNSGETIMTEEERKAKQKADLIDRIIGNEHSMFEEEDRSFLATCEISALEKMNVKAPEVKKPDPAPVDAPEVNDKPAKPKTMDEYIAEAPPEMQAVLRNGVASHQAEVNRLVNTILANEDKNTFTEAQLKAMPVENLRSIARFAVTDEQEQKALFDGQGDIAQNADVGELPLPPAVLNAVDKKD